MRTRPRNGFTLLEVMVVVAIIGVLSAMSMFALNRLVHNTQFSGDRFSLVRLVSFAKSRALSQGRDVYVVFAYLDQLSTPTPSAPQKTPRVYVFDDPDGALRGLTLDQWLAYIEDPTRSAQMRERMVSDKGAGSIYYRTTTAAVQANCDTTSQFPRYLSVSGARLTTQECTPVACTFCKKLNGICVGFLRFSADGAARLMTDATGSGGLLRLIDPRESGSSCLAITEPSGTVVSLFK